MRAATDLAKFNDAIQGRIRRVRERLSTGLGNSTLEGLTARDAVIATAVVELDNVLVSGLRTYALSTLFNARTMGGHRITHTAMVANERQASAFILSVKNVAAFLNRSSPVEIGRKLEPTIRDPKDTDDILAACSASNRTGFGIALGFNFSVFENLGTVRNFYGHRSLHTWNKARNKARVIGLNPMHANEFVTSQLTGRPVMVFDDWADELSIFFDQVAQ